MLDRYNNQARFVQMIVDKELIVSNRKKAVIVAELRKLEFRPFPKVSKAKAAGENADVVEEEEAEEEGTDADYDYLLGMPIWSLTKEKVRQRHHNCDDWHNFFLAIDRETQAASRRQERGIAYTAQAFSK